MASGTKSKPGSKGAGKSPRNGGMTMGGTMSKADPLIAIVRSLEMQGNPRTFGSGAPGKPGNKGGPKGAKGGGTLGKKRQFSGK